jgi:signal transduction histidine kinase
VGIFGFLRRHLDSLVAVALSAVFLARVALAEEPLPGKPYLDLGGPFTPSAAVDADQTLAIIVCTAFLLSLAARTTLPLLPLGLAFPVFVVLGRGTLDANVVLLMGMLLAVYSVGAWSGGRAALVGALGVGLLIGLAVLRTRAGLIDPRDVALPALFLVGAWAVGLAARSVRIARADERVTGSLDWSVAAGAPDSPGRDETVRELRDLVERAMSAVVMEARAARRELDRDPAAAHRSLAVVEAAGTEALEQTQRLTGLLLSPLGTPLPEPRPGLADVDLLAEQLSKAGLPVDTRVEGRPVPLTGDLDAVGYRVAQEALLATLEGTVSAHARVVVRYEPDELQVEVTDDGIAADGADPTELTAGLLAVRKEVAALGGTLDAGPGDDRGYWVLARLPYEPDWE